MARNRQSKFKIDASNTVAATIGGGATALAWEGLDLIPKLKEKPMIAPLITLAMGIAAGGYKTTEAAGYGMTGASSCELVSQLITKMREGKEDPAPKKTLNGQLNNALHNPEFKAKFQQLMQTNPQFRQAMTRQMNETDTCAAEKTLNAASNESQELFNMALDVAA